MHKPQQRPPDGAASERFEEIFLKHHAAVVGYVRRRAPAETVDDAVGETFLVAWRRLDRVPEESLPWLLAVARNVLATQRRGSRRRDALVSRLRGAESLPYESSPAMAEGDGRVLDALARLGEKDREALTLIAWDGLTPQEAAGVLRETPGTFRVRLHRARQRLRRLLDEEVDRAVSAPPAIEHRTRIGEPVHE
jgi:RNA polymerase sigma factor (sigma-70 family)